MSITVTVTQDGHALTETVEGITMPADYSFATVNDYAHGVGVQFEDLVALCLGMAYEIDSLRESTDYAWRNTRVIEKARQEEISKLDAAVMVEREACARVCEGFVSEVQNRYANGAFSQAAEAIWMRFKQT